MAIKFGTTSDALKTAHRGRETGEETLAIVAQFARSDAEKVNVTVPGLPTEDDKVKMEKKLRGLAHKNGYKLSVGRTQDTGDLAFRATRKAVTGSTEPVATTVTEVPATPAKVTATPAKVAKRASKATRKAA